MNRIDLKVTNREILGKKVRFLRRERITPVHLFGHGIKSRALQCDTAELQQLLAHAGKTRLVSLKCDDEKKPRTVVIREVQKEPLTGELIHIDFYQVKMAEKVKMEIPIILVGETPALKSKENTLVQELNTLTVECLPINIPASVELGISPLVEPEQGLRVKDIELDKEVTVLNDPELLVVKISSRPIEKIVEEKIEEEAVETPEEEPKKEWPGT